LIHGIKAVQQTHFIHMLFTRLTITVMNTWIRL
jgi:hypothetical protein